MEQFLRAVVMRQTSTTALTIDSEEESHVAASILPQRCPHCIDDSRIFTAPKRKNVIDIHGQEFDLLIVEHFVGICRPKGAYWCCRCQCGGHAIVCSNGLRTGNSGSCGCRGQEQFTRLSHGMAGTREYRSYHMMVQRCTNPQNTNFRHYAGRGITVCPEWLASFEAFYADMGQRPPGMSIERRDNMLGYNKDNCYWAVWNDQCNNKRTSHFITWNDETLTIAQWSRKTGHNYQTLFNRLDTGWDIEQALTLPLVPREARSKRRRKSSKELI